MSWASGLFSFGSTCSDGCMIVVFSVFKADNFVMWSEETLQVGIFVVT